MNTAADKKIEISIERDCILIEASKLSLNDDFMRYEPRTLAEEKFKTILAQIIEIGRADFYCPIMDPSFADNEKTKIHYKSGEEPAVGKSYNWWKEIVKDTEWYIGTKYEYIVFLGVLIKMLVAKGWTVDDAWDGVCNDFKKLDHSWNPDNIEETGSREVCGFFDLANTHKMLARDGGGIYTTCYRYFNTYSLTFLGNDKFATCNRYGSVAWLICKKEI